MEYHRDGHHTFERLYRVDLTAIAAEFLRQSPDIDMRLAVAVSCRRCGRSQPM